EGGGYAYLAAGATWGLENVSDDIVSFQWIRKAYERLEGYEAKSFVTSDAEVEPTAMPDTNGAWKTTRFTDSSDLAHDMQVNIVTFQPGGV
ncbi:hypothetical protein, partial [Staphylococcus epidermidis]|uniref:hypothetical protein n=1 Tax=Staphylococcus epidermidis TaxID=1282 RepID=UPI001C92C2D2